MIAKQSCWRSEFLFESGSRVAGFKIVLVCKETLGLSDKMAL